MRAAAFVEGQGEGMASLLLLLVLHLAPFLKSRSITSSTTLNDPPSTPHLPNQPNLNNTTPTPNPSTKTIATSTASSSKARTRRRDRNS